MGASQIDDSAQYQLCQDPHLARQPTGCTDTARQSPVAGSHARGRSHFIDAQPDCSSPRMSGMMLLALFACRLRLSISG
jgi:hypothetical protein